MIRPESDGKFHVRPGDDIQQVIEAAGASDTKVVLIHTGDYRPARKGQAFVWFNSKHDGIQLEADGVVTLHADNIDIANKDEGGYPAVVNHILYFGDGITSATKVSGLRLTGANGFATRSEEPQIQPDTGSPKLEKAQFFYEDGGAIKVFGRSSPILEELDVVDNYASPCGGGVSIEQRGFQDRPAVFHNCLFHNNRCRITGSGVDVLPGSSAEFHNCLFVGNISNTGTDDVSSAGAEYNRQHGCGALTVFGDSAVTVERCTFAFNWNGVDDKSRRNVYRDSIFWQNTAAGGISPGERYELDILSAASVEGCFINGQIDDLRSSIDTTRNTLDSPDPEFDRDWVPQASAFQNVGYRPTGRWEVREHSETLIGDESRVKQD